MLVIALLSEDTLKIVLDCVSVVVATVVVVEVSVLLGHWIVVMIGTKTVVWSQDDIKLLTVTLFVNTFVTM